MTRDEVIRLAREANPTFGEYLFLQRPQFMERFAALVAAAEREECAKVCDAKVGAEYDTGKVDHNEMGWTQSCAIAIRARGQS